MQIDGTIMHDPLEQDRVSQHGHHHDTRKLSGSAASRLHLLAEAAGEQTKQWQSSHSTMAGATWGPTSHEQFTPQHGMH